MEILVAEVIPCGLSRYRGLVVKYTGTSNSCVPKKSYLCEEEKNSRFEALSDAWELKQKINRREL